ncbi:hypothetical protein ACFP7A_04500 [Sporolactobacillus kofuensis]|uniref:Uncharacterized protein n=1 Tax=Sporolactobacillus kofuensis TaxID=269672 RepID=A0ABW1WCE9_9BACL|nr:hypothetical protein [Sporolactobacillus kofuensis]MCO7174897.1 hypothetical protein [Sporolactobacillus kofuensis]
MHEFKLFTEEKREIDELLNKDCSIVRVQENLDGAFIQFTQDDQTITLHIRTPDGRKYLTNQLSAKRLNRTMT